jgi:hypothetical protein
MRRSFLIAISATAMVAAMAVGPFGAAAAAPYVYGCTPATFFGAGSAYNTSLSIYNGSATTASLTIKVLAGNGTRLSVLGFGYEPPLTSTLAATHTASYLWSTPGGIGVESTNDIPASVRIVSSEPVAAVLSHDYPTSSTDWKPIDCISLQP